MRLKKCLISILFLLLCACLCAGVLSACNNDENKRGLYIISFNTQGGTPVDTMYLKENASINLPENPPERQGYVFTGWYIDKDCLYRLNVSTYRVKRNITIFAGWESVETYRHAITVLTTSENGTIEIVTPEDKRARKGDVVTVEIKCGAGYVVKDGTLKANGIALTQSEERYAYYEFVMPAEPVTVTCEFELEPHSVTVLCDPLLSEPNGTVVGSVEKAQSGDAVTLLILPDYGYKLKSIYFQDGTALNVGVSNTCLFYMGTEEVTIIAEFEEIDRGTYYSVSADNNANGQIIFNTAKANAGEYVEVSATPIDGYMLNGITVRYSVKGASVYTRLSGNSFVMPTSDVSVGASFIVIDKQNDEDYELTITEPVNGKINIKDIRNSYKAGEKISFSTIADNGYGLGGVYANGIYVAGDSFYMPKSDCNITVDFLPIGHSISVEATDSDKFTSVLSAEFASYGDKITVDIIPDEGYVFAYEKLVYNENVRINYGVFLMPDEDVTIYAKVVEKGTAHAVNLLNSSIGGSVTADKTTACEYERVTVTAASINGYVLADKGITVTYTLNGEKKTLSLSNNDSFSMPDADNVCVTAKFDRVFGVEAYDDGKIYATPSSTSLKIGGNVYFNVGAYEDYLTEDVKLSVAIGTYTESLDSANVFELTADKAEHGDTVSVTASTAHRTTDKSRSYYITVRTTSGGAVSVGRNGGIAAGTLVKLNVSPNKGYKLKSLNIVEPNNGYTPICDVFTMPESAVEIYAEFEQISDSEKYVFGLESSYKKNLQLFNRYGFTVSYQKNRYDLYKVFDNTLSDYAGYICGAVSVKAKYGHDFYIFEINDLSEVARIANATARILDEKFNAESTVYFDNNYFVVSPYGNAEEDFYFYRNGINDTNNFLLYKRKDGTYGVFAYRGSDVYIKIPESYSNRAVTYIAPYAFGNAQGVLSLDLSYVCTLDRFALYGLKEIKNIDLKCVSSIGTGVFMDCTALERISAPSSNLSFSTQDGVLFNASRTLLIAYPASKEQSAFTVPSKVKVIASYAFYGAKNLTQMIYSGGLTTISSYAFSNAKKLAGISYMSTIGVDGIADFGINRSTVTYIGDYAFYGADSLTTFNLDTIQRIGKYAFNVCAGKQLNINLSSCVSLPGAYFAPIDNTADGSLKITIGSLQEKLYKNHLVWSNYDYSIL